MEGHGFRHSKESKYIMNALKNKIHKCINLINSESIDDVINIINEYPDLKTYRSNDDSILLHAYINSEIFVKRLLEAGCDPNVPDSTGGTILMKYCASGNIEMVKFLIDKGANVNAEEEGGETPISWSCHESQLSCAKILYEKGAKISFPENTNAWKAMMQARECASLEFISFLDSLKSY